MADRAVRVRAETRARQREIAREASLSAVVDALRTIPDRKLNVGEQVTVEEAASRLTALKRHSDGLAGSIRQVARELRQIARHEAMTPDVREQLRTLARKAEGKAPDG